MKIVFDVACILFCLAGGLYASWPLAADGLGPAPSGTADRSRTGRARRVDLSARINWVLQAVLAGAFVAGAGIIAASVRQEVALARPADEEAAVSMQVPGMQAVPARRLFCDEFKAGCPLVGADLADLPITDADVRALVRCGEGIEFLNLTGTQVSDEIIPVLSQLTQLTDLSLTRTGITDAGVQRLAQLAKLQSLSLARTRVTDAGLRHLTGLNDLNRLFLQYTAVTNAGLEALGRLGQLEYIACYGTAVTDQGIRQLASRLPRLAQSLSDDEAEGY